MSDPQQNAEQYVAEIGRHQRQLYLYLLSLVLQPADAEDLLQETNLILWQKIDQFEPGSNFFAWASRIAFNKVLQFRSGRGRDAAWADQHVVELLADEALQMQEALERRRAASEGRRSALELCLQKLRPEDRELISRRYVVGASGEAVARDLQRPVNSIYQSLSRIRRALHQCITRHENAAEGTT